MDYFKKLWSLFLGGTPNTPGKTLDVTGIWATVRDVLIFAVAAGAVEALQAIDAIDFSGLGTLGPFDVGRLVEQGTTLGIGAAIVAVRRWSKDYQNPPKI